MCQINTSAVSTLGDDYGGISTTDVLPSSARGQFAQSSFVSVRVVVVTKKKPNGSESPLKEPC